MRRYRVVERVVFAYTHVVEARSKNDAMRRVDARGDGEAIDHTEVVRSFVSVELDDCRGTGCRKRHVHS